MTERARFTQVDLKRATAGVLSAPVPRAFSPSPTSHTHDPRLRPLRPSG